MTARVRLLVHLLPALLLLAGADAKADGGITAQLTVPRGYCAISDLEYPAWFSDASDRQRREPDPRELHLVPCSERGGGRRLDAVPVWARVSVLAYGRNLRPWSWIAWLLGWDEPDQVCALLQERTSAPAMVAVLGGGPSSVRPARVDGFPACLVIVRGSRFQARMLLIRAGGEVLLVQNQTDARHVDAGARDQAIEALYERFLDGGIRLTPGSVQPEDDIAVVPMHPFRGVWRMLSLNALAFALCFAAGVALVRMARRRS